MAGYARRFAAALFALAGVIAASDARADALVSIGSDTMRPLMERWADAFVAADPAMRIEIRSPGSNAAPDALIARRSLLAPMSRKMTDAEIDAFRTARGQRPLKLVVALDALAIYAHAGNPIGGLTLAQVDRMFSQDRLCAGGPAYRTWRPFVFGAFGDRPIELHSRNRQSGTYTAFREMALCGGAMADGVIFHDDTADLMAAIAARPNAAGVAGLGGARDGVKQIPIAENEDEPFVPAIPQRHAASADRALRYKNIVSGKYPLSRELNIYIDPARDGPDAARAAAARAFLWFVLSEDGQAIVAEAGFVPLPGGALQAERRKLSPDYAPRWWRLEKPEWWPFG